jgi:hypothetical protein
MTGTRVNEFALAPVAASHSHRKQSVVIGGPHILVTITNKDNA